MSEENHFIDGQWSAGEGDAFSSINPATGEFVWQGRAATASEVQQAVESARKALPAWAGLSFSQRCQFLQAFVEQLKEHKSTLLECISAESGKPNWEAVTEVNAMIAKLAISIKAYHARTDKHSEQHLALKSVTCHRPQGVVAVFGPFNFPGHLPNGHIMPALLAGNTIVLKPSELTPWVAHQIMRCWQAANLPAGVLNLLQGGKETGMLLAQADINGLFFTGSYATGKKLHEQFAGHPEKILVLELGGNNPLIVSGVKDIAAAAYLTILSAFITAGQRCTCARRLFVPEGQAGDDFIQQLVEMTKKITVAAASKRPEPFMGPVSSTQSAMHLLDVQKQLEEQGAQALLTMRQLQEDTGLLTPAILDVTHVATHEDEEIFGPLLQVMRCKDLDAAISLANDSDYGLSAGLFSDSRENFNTFYTAVQAGIVNWNCPLTGALNSVPFGGIGKSGNHRPGAYYAADYCAHPVASLASDKLALPESLMPGITL